MRLRRPRSIPWIYASFVGNSYRQSPNPERLQQLHSKSQKEKRACQHVIFNYHGSSPICFRFSKQSACHVHSPISGAM
ncbi:unnamed protein product [Urochloa humidicola]